MDIKELLRNPLVIIVLILLAIYLAFRILAGFFKFFWVILPIAVVLYFVSPRFKAIIDGLYDRITQR